MSECHDHLTALLTSVCCDFGNEKNVLFPGLLAWEGVGGFQHRRRRHLPLRPAVRPHPALPSPPSIDSRHPTPQPHSPAGAILSLAGFLDGSLTCLRAVPVPLRSHCGLAYLRCSRIARECRSFNLRCKINHDSTGNTCQKRAGNWKPGGTKDFVVSSRRALRRAPASRPSIGRGIARWLCGLGPSSVSPWALTLLPLAAARRRVRCPASHSQVASDGSAHAAVIMRNRAEHVCVQLASRVKDPHPVSPQPLKPPLCLAILRAAYHR